MGINFSMHELAHPDFFTYLNQWLRDASTHIAQRLDIEVTESAFNQVPPQVVSGLKALRKLGIRVAIDDFGAGQSSLARLHTLPFDVIKLDKQFVQQLNQPIVSAIVKAMVQLAQQFNKTLIAESVETLAQIQALKNLGCSLAQGFYYYEPQPLSNWLTVINPLEVMPSALLVPVSLDSVTVGGAGAVVSIVIKASFFENVDTLPARSVCLTLMLPAP